MGNIKKITEIGRFFTNDLEVNHSSHQYYLSNGVLTSNSHAIFYSMLGFETAYLKAHYPVEFLTANLILEDDSNAKISDKNITRIKREMRKSGIKILPPELNKSGKVYRILDSHMLLTGFNSLKYMGKDAIPEILAKRPFISFEDFLSKVDGRRVRVTAIQALAASGCLDGFGHTRKEMFLHASDYKKKLQVWNKKQDRLAVTAKKANKPYERKSFEYPWPENTGEWTISEMYAQETYYMGEAFCCGLRDAYTGFFNNQAFDFSTLSEIFPEPKDLTERYFLTAKDGIVQGVIRDYFEFKVKNEKSSIFGKTMAKIDIEDLYGNIVSMTMFPSGLEMFNDRLRALTNGKAKLEAGTGIYCAASANWYEGDVSLVFENLKKGTPMPSRPSDLKHRTVRVKISRVREKVTTLDPDSFLNQVEDELIEDGHAELLE